MKLIITEKPSVAISIAKVLGVEGRKNGYIENKDYVISWCIGHLVGLAQADSYDEKYKKWSYDDLPIIPSDFKYEVFKASKKQYDILRKLMNRTDITEIINACDSGREGELIFRLVYSQTLSKKPIKRLWISSMEESAIKDGFNNLRNGIEFDNLYKSALARAQADWLVGINATRLFTVLYNQLLSVGRVQTPTLALIVNREEEIINFVKEKFYHLDLIFKDFIASSEKFTDKDKLEELQNKVKDNIAIVKEIKVENKKTNPPLPFDLTSLQREANRLFSYTAKQTLDYAQALYEKKWITYPRTDSRYLTDEMLGTLEKLVKILDKDKMLKEANFSRIINNKKVQDHHALIPTKESLNMDKNNIPKTEKQIYDLVTIKLLESLSMPYEEEVMAIVLEVAESRFTAKGKRILDLGYKQISKNYNKKGNEEIKENILPKISKDIKLQIENTKIREGLTQPPISIRYQRKDNNLKYKAPKNYMDIKFDKENDVKTNEQAVKELAILGMDGCIDYPKPLSLIIKLLKMILNDDKDAIVLDFFSGSSTTAHSVIELNAIDEGNRKFIMVQLPENLDTNLERAIGKSKITIETGIEFLDSINKPHLLTEIGKERIRRAGEKIMDDYKNKEGIENLDTGFKVFKVEDTNFRRIKEAENGNIDTKYKSLSEKDLEDFNPHFTDLDIVYELMLRRQDIELTEEIKKLDHIGDRTFIVGDTMLVCLEEKITEEIVEKIGKINTDLSWIILRDSAFEDDCDLKVNTTRKLRTIIKESKKKDQKIYWI